MSARHLPVIAAICLAVLVVRPGFDANGQGTSTTAPLKSPIPAMGPFSWACEGVKEPTVAMFYKSEPGLLVLKRGTETRVAFNVISGSGARYLGDGVSFWEARGEATINWSGRDERCRRSQ
jgi:membrane-bound inhibitor of C-type lysozyme